MRFAFMALLTISCLQFGAAMADEPRIIPLAVGNVYTFPSKEYGPRQLKVVKINTTTVDVHDLTFNMDFSLPAQAFVNRPGIPAQTKPAPQVAWKSLEASAQRENPIQPVAHAEPANLDETQPWPGDIFVLRNAGEPSRQVEVVRTEPGPIGGSVTQVRDRNTGKLFPIPTSTLVDMIRLSMVKAPQPTVPASPKLNLEPQIAKAIQMPVQKLELPPQQVPPTEKRTDKPVTLFNIENREPSPASTPPKLAIIEPVINSAPAQPKLDEDMPWPGDVFVLRTDSQSSCQVEVVRIEPGASDNEVTMSDSGMSSSGNGMSKIDNGMTVVRDTKTSEQFPIQTSVLVEMIRTCKNVKPEAEVVVQAAPQPETAIRDPEMKLELPKQIIVASATSEPTKETVVATSTLLPANLQNVPLLEAKQPLPSAPPKLSTVVQTMPMQQTVQEGFGEPYATAARFATQPSALPTGMPTPDEVADLLEPERTLLASDNNRPFISAKPTTVTPQTPMAVTQPTRSNSIEPMLAIKTQHTPAIVTPAPSKAMSVAVAPSNNVQAASLSSPVSQLYTAHASPQLSGIRPLSRSGVAQMRQEIGPMLHEMGHALRPSLRQRAVSIVAYGRFGWRPEVQQAIADAAINDPAPEVRAFCIATLSNLGYDDTEYLSHLVQWAEATSTDVVQQTAYSAYSKLIPSK